MSPPWTDVTTALTAAGAVILAAGAWFTSMNALRTTYRPVIRVVPLRIGGVGLVLPQKMLLKNIGSAAAVGVLVYEVPVADDAEPIAHVELVEPLNDATEETERRGRVPTILNPVMTHGRDYRVIYQDIAGAWHETRFTLGEEDLSMRLLGPRRWYHVFTRERAIPKSAKMRALVVRAHEAV